MLRGVFMKNFISAVLISMLLVSLCACTKSENSISTIYDNAYSSVVSYSSETSSSVVSKTETSSKETIVSSSKLTISSDESTVSSESESQPENNPIIPTVPTVDDQSFYIPDGEITYRSKADYGYTYDTSKSQKHTWLPIEEKYCYSLLNPREKEIYLKIDKAVRSLKSEIKLGKNTSFEQIQKVMEYYEYDNPECFYFQYRGGTFYEISGEFSAKLFYNFGENKTFQQDFEGLSQKQLDKLKSRIVEFNNAVEDFISTIPADAPDVVKEILIYDKLIIDSKYNLSAVEDVDNAHQDNFTPYGILINKTGVCESYSESFQLLCNAVGINCIQKYGDNHQWNAVMLDGEWYECDVTFDDPINGKDNEIYAHTFFNRTTAFMNTEHPEVIVYSTPTCSATKYDFLKYFHNK